MTIYDLPLTDEDWFEALLASYSHSEILDLIQEEALDNHCRSYLEEKYKEMLIDD